MALRPPGSTARLCRPATGLLGGRRVAVLVGVLAVLIAAGWGVGQLTRSWHATDLQAVRDVAAHRSPAETELARVLSRLGSSLVIGFLALAGCLILYRRAGAAAAARLAISVGGAVVIFNADKLLVARPRPPVAHLEAVTNFSFPSGHATLSAAFYLALLILSVARPGRGRRAAAAGVFVVALLLGIAASRVYLGVHYPTDVAAGLTLGAAWAAAVAAVYRRAKAQPTQAPP